MGKVNKPYTFSDEEDADPTKVNENYDKLYDLVNGELDEENLDLTANSVKEALLEAIKDVDGDGSGLEPDYTKTLKRVYPVGSKYTNFEDDTNPEELLGFGTWERIAEGRVIVGVDEDDSDFDTSEATGGEKEHTLTEKEFPEHDHSGSTSTDGSHNHDIYGSSAGDMDNDFLGLGYDVGIVGKDTGKSWYSDYIDSDGSHDHSFTTDNTGGGEAHNNLQPYITAYIWKRTA